MRVMGEKGFSLSLPGLVSALGLLLGLLACSAPQPTAHGAAASGAAGELAGLGPLFEVSSGRRVSFRGEAQVLVFWTAWCEPSRRSLQRIAKRFAELRPEGCRLVSVTFHEDADAAAALEELALPESDVVTHCRDEFGQAFRATRVRGTPVAVLLDRDGERQAVTHPDEVDGRVIAALARGQEVLLPPTAMIADKVADDAWDVRAIAVDADAKPGVSLTPVEAPGNFARLDPATGIITAPGARADTLLAYGLGVSAGRIEWGDVEGREALFRVRIVPPDGDLATSRLSLLAALRDCSTWAWAATAPKREAWVLSALDGEAPPRSEASEASAAWRGPTFRGAARIAQLAAWLESITRTPALDETGFGDALFDLDIRVESLATLPEILARHGLQLRKAERAVPGYRVSRARD